MQETNFDPKGKTIVAIFAHPDDADFTCSASLAKFISEGATGYYAILTNGSKGSNDPAVSKEWIVDTRRKEQESAAKVLGVKEVIFLDHEDCELEVNVGTKGEVVKIIRQLKPDVVITFDPTRFYSTQENYINHTDHRAVGEIVCDAVFPLTHSHLMYPDHLKEGLGQHKTAELWLSNFDEANFFVDISDTISLKLAALACHASQLNDSKETEEWVATRAQKMGTKSKKYKLAEGFIRFQFN